jgi:glyoxylase-like metal-dependent hydrolase (beta-lactamase superfamily II)
MVREPTPGIFEIDTLILGHEKLIAAYLVVGSEKTVLIDPGFPSSADTVLKSVSEAGFDPEKLDYIALTHTHIDHAGGAGIISSRARDAKVLTHQRGSFYLKNSIKIAGGSKMVFGDLSEKLGLPVDTQNERIKVVGDGDRVDLGGKELSFYYTPGHSGDHISIFENKSGTLFTGDTGCLNYPALGNVLIPAGSPPIYRTDYIINELERLSGLNSSKILTPHYGEAKAQPVTFINDNIRTVKETRIRIDRMFREGMEFPQVIERLRTDIIEESGISKEHIPPFLLNIWLRLMLKTGLMGLMADILQYSRDIRPFTETLYVEDAL